MNSRLTPLRGPDHGQILRQALAVRAAGGVPLVGDERWSETRWRELVDAAVEADIPDEADWAVLTSGSTGRPRIIVRTQRSWDVAYPRLNEVTGIGADDRMLIPVHPVSSMATFAVSHAAHTGFEFSVPQHSRLGAADILDATVLHGTPWHLSDAVDLLDAGCPSRLRVALVGGDRLPAELRSRAERHGISVYGYVGASEFSLIAVDAGDGAEIFEGVEVDIRDGVLWVKTQQMALSSIGGDGNWRRDGSWATVGDRASLNAGRLVMHGRDDDAILTAGATVIPADVEAVLNGLPGVRASLVVGVPSRRAGMLVAAALEIEGRVDEAFLKNEAAAALSPAERPRRWKIVRTLPRTSAGKIRRLSPEEFLRLAEIRPDIGQ